MELLLNIDTLGLEKIFKENKFDIILYLATCYKKYHLFDDIDYMIRSNVNFPVKLLDFAGNLLRQTLFTENRIKIRIKDSGYLFSNELTEEHYKLLPNTEQVMEGTFWIGVWPGITEEGIGYVVKSFEKFFERY
ncbi:MAG: hypothetical protein ACP5G1_03785 [Nanopusillaceae archaeon]